MCVTQNRPSQSHLTPEQQALRESPALNNTWTISSKTIIYYCVNNCCQEDSKWTRQADHIFPLRDRSFEVGGWGVYTWLLPHTTYSYTHHSVKHHRRGHLIYCQETDAAQHNVYHLPAGPKLCTSSHPIHVCIAFWPPTTMPSRLLCFNNIFLYETSWCPVQRCIKNLVLSKRFLP